MCSKAAYAKAGNRVRITGQLIDTTTGAHIWADRFDGVIDDIFELQAEVASRVAGAIEPKLRKPEFERASRKPTESLDAYDLYLRALALRDTHTDESVAEAIDLLKRALAIDPNYAPAKALVGWSRAHQGSHGRSLPSEAERVEAVALARQALERGEGGPGHAVDGRAYSQFLRRATRRGGCSRRSGAGAQSELRPRRDGTRLCVA